MNPASQIITSLEAEIADFEALGQDCKGRRELLNQLKVKADPVWRALAGDPDKHPEI